MSMTSNFRANRFIAGALLVMLAAAAAAQNVAPDAPRTRPTAEPTRRPATVKPVGRVELKSVRVRKAAGDDARFAGAAFLKGAREPLAIEVQTEQPLGDVWRDAAPVIVLNDERLVDTHISGADRLVGFVPDREKIRDINTVTVEWVGERQPTKTRRALTFRRDGIAN